MKIISLPQTAKWTEVQEDQPLVTKTRLLGRNKIGFGKSTQAQPGQKYLNVFNHTQENSSEAIVDPNEKHNKCKNCSQ